MSQETAIPLYSLVLHKKRPGRVVKTGDRLEIELEGGNVARVRAKDVTLLHPGPLHSLAGLRPLQGEHELAWQIMAESDAPHTLAEMAELIYGEYTPASAWAAWQWVEDGLYFRGEPGAVIACSPQEVAAVQAARQARQAEAEAWAGFVARAPKGDVSPQGDARFLRELEDLALGRRKDSRLLRELGRSERPENAHALLLAWGVWDHNVNPYPVRLGLPTTPPTIDLPALADGERRDLTALPAFAIDDRNNQDPDDALSLVSCQLDEQGRLVHAQIWVHVADAAALVSPDSPADLEARARGATLYLPEGPVPMLPAQAVQALGLGLQEISPAISFGLELNAAAEITAIEICPSLVRVQRLSYEQAEARLAEEPFHSLDCIARACHARRRASGAFLLDFPEVMLRVVDGQVCIEPVLRLRSRDLVREAMLLAGEAAARFAIQHDIPFPYATQEAASPPASETPTPGRPAPLPASAPPEESLAGRFAMRRWLKRSQVSSLPAPHAGVGLPAYSRATSPLRRYLDLVVHQQLRAYLRSQPILSAQAMIERLGNAEAITGVVNQAESLARRHWTLVYLLQHPGWQGEGILVEKNGLRGYVIIPELALEAPLHLNQDLPLDSSIPLEVRGLNLPELEVHFACR